MPKRSEARLQKTIDVCEAVDELESHKKSWGLLALIEKVEIEPER